MKIFLTGGTGYIGNHLALSLASKGNCVHLLARNTSSPNLPKHKNIVTFQGDITQRSSLTKAMSGCEQVYHTAALVSLYAKDPSAFFKVNVEGTKNVLAEALELGVKKLVFTSSCGVLGASLNKPRCETDPRIHGFDNDYEFTKFMAENLVKEFGTRGLFTVIVSPSKVYGPGIETHPFSLNKVIHKFITGGISFVPKPVNLVNCFCFINDITEGHIAAMEKGLGGEKYILGGENVSYSAFFQQLRLLSNTKTLLVPVPQFIVKAFSGFVWLQSQLTGKDSFITPKGVKHIYCNRAFSSDKAIRHLGYHITPLKEGLQQTIQFLKQRHDK